MLASTCIVALLRGDPESHEALAGAAILNDVARTIIGIGRGLASG